MPEAIAVFDDHDRFVFWNRTFSEIYAEAHTPLHVGLSFQDHLNQTAFSGKIPEAIGREESWIAERLSTFHKAEGVHLHQLADGRWLRVQDRILENGGRVGIRLDVTDLIEREQSFRALFEANTTPMFLLDRVTLKIVAGNDAALELYGYSREAFLELHLTDIRPETAPGQIASMIDHLHEAAVSRIPRIHYTSAGEERIVRVNGRLIQYDGRPTILAAIFDMTEQIRLADEIKRSRAFLQSVLDHIPTSVFVKDMTDGGRYLFRNQASELVYGMPNADVLGRTDREFLGEQAAREIEGYDRAVVTLDAASTIHDEVRHLPSGVDRVIRTRRLGFADDVGRRYVVGTAEDVTEQRSNEARIAFMAHHDELTQLPNRYLLNDRLDYALARLAGTSELLALLLIDLDGFKAINDRWGHLQGDALLKLVAERISPTLRKTDIAARLGGDEFAVLMAPLEQVGEAAWFATRLNSILSAPFQLGPATVKISASIGIAIAPLAATEPHALKGAADKALYAAKNEGRNRFRMAHAA